MQLYSSILLGSLLATSLTNNVSSFNSFSEILHQSNSNQQRLFSQPLLGKPDCINRKDSPVPGCGRRDD
jgi:hypothetical protein